MIYNSKVITKLLYIQLLNFCIKHKTCYGCPYDDSAPCTLFNGIFEELTYSGARKNFESINQAYWIHKHFTCDKCPIKDSRCKSDQCGMIAFSERLFFSGIKHGR